MSVKFFVRAFVSFFLIVSISLMNVSIALAEGPTPPTATEEPTQDPAVDASQPDPAITETPAAEETPVSSDPAPVLEDTSDSGPFSQLPENTEVVVLDENGDSLPLVSSESLNVILEEDPKWCPEGELPDSVNCTANLTITQLLALMQTNENGKFNANGVIYFERSNNFYYQSSFILDDSTASLGSSYETIKNYNITLQGGWFGGNSAQIAVTDPTIFDNNADVVVRVGSGLNPWVGNVSIKNITVQDNDGLTNGNNPVPVYGPSVSVYTTTGDVTLNNVDVHNQADGQNTALIDSNSGNITVTNRSSFDGAGNNQGFSASTDTGTISITGTSGNGNDIAFSNSTGNGATLSAPIITLTSVTANSNDLNGIQISDANSITLNSVRATNNGTNINGGTGGGNYSNDLGSGVLVNGNPGSWVSVLDGTFTGNERFGIEVNNAAIYIGSAIDNCQNASSSGGCTNVTATTDTSAPIITFVSRTPAVNGWNNTDVTVIWSCSDAQSGVVSATVSKTITTEGTNQSVTGTCTNKAGRTSSNTQNNINIDKTGPTIAAHGPVSTEATSASGAVVNYTSPSTSDNVDGAGTATCTPASGSAFALGNTTVTCNATDSHNNPAAPTTFIVSVVDTTAPVIAAHGDETAEATSASGAVVNYTNPITSDIVDGVGTATCNLASGSTFGIGNNTVTCTATDAHNNAAIPTTFTVSVSDTTAPVIDAHGNETVEATSSTGAIVNYTYPIANDIVDGPKAATCLPSSGTLFALGDTVVTCNITDTYANVAIPTSFTVSVLDTTAPVIAAHSDITVQATSASGAVVTYTNPTTSDAVDGAGFAICTPASGSTFAVGNTAVTCTAKDARGNVAVPVTFTVHVQGQSNPQVTSPSSSNSSSSLIPVTGGVIDLECNTTIVVNGIKVTFHNLCKQQATLKGVDANHLPGQLPTGFTFVRGVDVTVLGQAVLQNNSGIQMDFTASASGKFAVLFWDNGKWVEITQSLNESDLAKALSTDASDELYNIVSPEKGMFKSLTTEKTGIFVLVKK